MNPIAEVVALVRGEFARRLRGLKRSIYAGAVGAVFLTAAFVFLLIAIFLPVTAIASLFGMNLRHGFEEITTPLVFWGVLIVGLALGWSVKVGVDSRGEPKS